MVPATKLWIVGYGVCPATDRPRRFDAIVRRTGAIIVLEPAHSAILELLRKYEAKVVNCIDLYTPGAIRAQVYEAVADEVIRRASATGSVAFVTEGNPWFLNTITDHLEDRARVHRLWVGRVPAQSSIDKLISVLRVPTNRLCLTIATGDAIVSGRCRPAPTSVLFVTQAGNIGSELVTLGNVSQRAVEALQQQLTGVYGIDARWMLVHLSDRVSRPSAIVWNQLSNLYRFHKYMHSGTLLVSADWWPEELEQLPRSEIVADA